MSGSREDLTYDTRAFGGLIRQKRRDRHLTQEALLERIRPVYSDVRAYRRMESGVRRPSREDAITILTRGIGYKEESEVDAGLALLGYSALDQDEIRLLRLPQPLPPAKPLEITGPASTWAKLAEGISSHVCLTSAVGISLAIGIAAAVWEIVPAIALLCALLYAALYGLSVLLESTYQAERRGVITVGVAISTATMLTSLAAVAVDRYLVLRGSHVALLFTVTVFWLSATAQWLFARRTLSAEAVVQLSFQALTAQAAHLKNSLYFLFIALFFWVSPMHAITVLRYERQLGHTEFVRQIAGAHLMLGRGIVAFDPTALAGLLAAMLGASLLMGARLLENLRAGHRRDTHNVYSLLLYLRAALCFALSIVCLGWFADSLGRLLA